MDKKFNVIIVYSILKDAILLDKIKVPNLMIINKLEDLSKITKNGEINKICIISGADGYNGKDTVEKINKYNLNVPILVWNGSYDIPHNTVIKNACYMDTSELKKVEDIYKIIEQFFND